MILLFDKTQIDDYENDSNIKYRKEKKRRLVVGYISLCISVYAAYVFIIFSPWKRQPNDFERSNRLFVGTWCQRFDQRTLASRAARHHHHRRRRE